MKGTSWRAVQDELVARISAGTWPPGALLPAEAALAAEFGCARTTVNRAMRGLAERGLVDRKRRAGTRVARHPPARATLTIPVIRAEVEGQGASWSHRLLSRAAAPAAEEVAARLGLPEGAPMLHLTALHLADAAPFLHEDRWINLAALPEAEEVDFTAQSPNEWLLAHVPYTTGDIALSASAATGATARHLAAPEGTPLFTLDRATWNGPAPVTQVRLSYAPGYRLLATL
ncbi:UTRA domain-containing protein [Pseudoroseicyclus sp. CXY001]|uniref:UTRA domain-containing protein n=1 Tax=Pseudoroseicyclus sp. CXY001 TaxID=3242492 RepID=UPI00358DA560